MAKIGLEANLEDWKRQCSTLWNAANINKKNTQEVVQLCNEKQALLDDMQARYESLHSSTVTHQQNSKHAYVILTQYQELQEEVKQLKLQLIHLNSQIESFQHAQNIPSDRETKLKEELRNETAKVKHLTRSLENTNQSKAKALEDATQESKSLKSDIERLESKIQDLETVKIDLEADKNKAKRKQNKLPAKIEELEKAAVPKYVAVPATQETSVGQVHHAQNQREEFQFASEIETSGSSRVQQLQAQLKSCRSELEAEKSFRKQASHEANGNERRA
jgi:chromosome segregation ATPase